MTESYIILYPEMYVLTGFWIHLEEDILTWQGHALKQQTFRTLLVALFTAKTSLGPHSEHGH